MEEKSRTKFAILIAVILAAAVIYSFTFSLFEETPSVGLAGPGDTSQSGEQDPSLSGDDAVLVKITPQTVQNVIATLTRYRSYSRTVQIEYLNEGEVLGTFSAFAAVDNGWTSVELTTPSGVEHTIIGDDTCYRWYDGEREYAVWSAVKGSDDLAQRLPTYETVLQLDPSIIMEAGYENRGGVSCIYVETEEKELGYSERYWISVESGLLVSVETRKSEELIYRMTAYEVESPLSDVGNHFILPDGTKLHQAEG